ncbi:hypothetical protein HIM_06051 [Hirsutella minnesotensis 3608]|uniref:Uncharacterized protein n=1 Tax=Hirsutella minnesotensis 3608 TaxID=1043627 RepID=A0A0F7ZNW4_9HYPO|nr:hypothetical protein HIM_06051 [Hirsutella minnesotensis 3608]
MAFLDVAFLVAARAASVLLPMFILYAGYTLFFHPLHRYPGPFVAKFTDAYGGYFAVRKCLHLTTHQNFQKYGKYLPSP